MQEKGNTFLLLTSVAGTFQSAVQVTSLPTQSALLSEPLKAALCSMHPLYLMLHLMAKNYMSLNYWRLIMQMRDHHIILENSYNWRLII